MTFWLSCFVFLINISSAGVVTIRNQVINDTQIIRKDSKISVIAHMKLEEGDEAMTMGNPVVLYLYPSTQIYLAKNSRIKISKHLTEDKAGVKKVHSIIELIQGIVHLQVMKDNKLEIDQSVVGDSISFAVRGTEFEVAKEGLNYDLDVLKGEVEASSPYVQTFVPEIVKAQEGFRFNLKEKSFQRRKFVERLKGNLGFSSPEEIQKKWKQK